MKCVNNADESIMQIKCMINMNITLCIAYKFAKINNFIYLFIWLRRVLVVARGILVAACRIFHCSAWASLWLWCAGSKARGLNCPTECGILVPQPGIEPMSPALEGGFLTTGPPGKSPNLQKLGNIFPELKTIIP